MHKTRPVRLGIYSAPVSGTLRVIFCGQLVARKSLITMVALTGIESVCYQFSQYRPLLSVSFCVRLMWLLPVGFIVYLRGMTWG